MIEAAVIIPATSPLWWVRRWREEERRERWSFTQDGRFSLTTGCGEESHNYADIHKKYYIQYNVKKRFMALIRSNLYIFRYYFASSKTFLKQRNFHCHRSVHV